ncbi:Protein CBG20541 [Caenorhabditis briggsae]|uniref:Uncharacterized protein n=2 Tax=Caenorhabditis briggsae TaxID=6238 RepID=A0AAE9D2F7_CAEBR|nr:Protein CBG20541 [Caenorhabditis briggsae]ULT92385.1 hypothetical protein L3Y34_009871 [Caenorhabditis briggsae]CAP37533.2 Protein CBG20541 [Caenorhabditis briggsae]
MTESEENLMGMEELQQFIQVPDDFPILEDSRSRMTSFSESSAAYLSGIEEEERLFALAALYTDQVINLNMRRRITYTDHLLGSVFDGPCVCPYEKCDLKLFDHRTYRQKKSFFKELLVLQTFCESPFSDFIKSLKIVADLLKDHKKSRYTISLFFW